MKAELYNALLDLKNNLKFKYMENGRTPVVCSDEALVELAEKAPKAKHELEYISGLGKVFVEKYGDAFMEILNVFHRRQSASKTLTHDVRQTLKNLENRLININKRNRLLFQPRLSSKTAVDLFGEKKLNYRLTESMLSNSAQKSRLVLCDCNTNNTDEQKLYKNLTALYRETTRQLKESGSTELYVGYPYIIGKLKGRDGFEIRAPLALFPAKLLRDSSKYYLTIDDSRDVLFNNNLVLSLYKFDGVSKPLPSNTAVKESRKGFEEEINLFYREAGFNVDITFGEPEKFVEYTADKFPKFNGGEFKIQNNVVLGKFPQYSSSMQRDFCTILESKEINDNLHRLLDNALPEKQNTDTQVTEDRLFYITDLNYSQEKAMTALDSGNSLVIQGPPGTGKSQTIASIVSDFAWQGKNVLLVSQKKAAIDVIYSRLKWLNGFALLIDDAKNKESFFGQIDNMLHLTPVSAGDKAGFEEINQKIETEIASLEQINSVLFKPDKNGNVFGEIYAENASNGLLLGKISPSAIPSDIPVQLLQMNYDQAKACRNLFDDRDFCESIACYLAFLERFPLLNFVKKDLGRYELFSLKSSAEEFLQQKLEASKLSFWQRMKKRSQLKLQAKKIVSTYFSSKIALKNIMKDTRKFVECVDFAERFLDVSDLYFKQSKDNQLWAKTVWKMSKSGISCQQGNSMLFDCLVFLMASNFEKLHRGLNISLNNYNFQVEKIAKLQEFKREKAFGMLNEKLFFEINNNILTAKRAADIKRAVESKRRMSVSKFVERFSFELFKGIKIWMMTPETVSEILPCEENFDLVVFDEASQIYIEKTVPSFARAKKAVIAGDHKQLRPSSLGVGRVDYDDESDDEDFESSNAVLEEESLLDLTRFKFNEVLLNYHYRSKFSQLINFSNHAFYGGRLFVSPNTEYPMRPPIEVLKVENGIWENRSNVAEAARVVALVKDILKNRRNNQTFGVICFNSNQRDLILDMLDDEISADPNFGDALNREIQRIDNGEDCGFFVKNIENVQGDERDIIIFSLAYSKTPSGRMIRNYGWLNQVGGENRLNVAITRAKEKIFLVTSITPEQLVVDDLSNEGPKVLKSYLYYANAVSNGDTARADEILEHMSSVQKSNVHASSVVRDMLVAELSRRGYLVEKDVGVGGYKLDFAVKDLREKYILGVEIDTSVYKDNTSRERDLHRFKYLSARGWTIHRVFSARFEPEKEAQIISNLIAKKFAY